MQPRCSSSGASARLVQERLQRLRCRIQVPGRKLMKVDASEDLPRRSQAAIRQYGKTPKETERERERDQWNNYNSTYNIILCRDRVRARARRRERERERERESERKK